MNQQIFICGCEQGGKVSPETVAAIRTKLEEQNKGYTYIQDLCGSVPRNPQDLLDIKDSKNSVIIACQPRAIKWLLDSAIFCTCGSEIEFLKADEILENGSALKLETNKKCIKKVEYTDNWKPWYPVIDYDRCTSCRKCLNFCLFGVFETDDDNRVMVAKPANCKDLCPACARACPEQAIIFPKHHESPIDGSNERIKMPEGGSILEQIQNEDVYAVLNQRRKAFKTPLLKVDHLKIAEEERRSCCSGSDKPEATAEEKNVFESSKEKKSRPDPNNQGGSCCC